MRYAALGAMVCVCLGLASTVQAQAPDPQVVAPINKFIEAFNKGDMVGAAATHAAEADLVILDEVAPFLWRGAKALQAWAADLEADAKKKSITEPKVTIRRRRASKPTVPAPTSSCPPSTPSSKGAWRCARPPR